MQLFKAFSAQTLGFVFIVAGIFLFPTLPKMPFLLWIQGILAAVFSKLLKQPIWWLPIHLGFVPALFFLLQFKIPPHVYFWVFTLFILVFWGTLKGDVPLFLSSNAVTKTINDVIKTQKAQSFAELGAGVGSIIIPIAKQNPNVLIDSWEHAPLPWLICKWRGRKWRNLTIQRDSFWEDDLSYYDIVFAFLSPAVMTQLDKKIKQEMHKDSLFISSCFPIPNRKPTQIKTLQDKRKTVLYFYQN